MLKTMKYEFMKNRFVLLVFFLIYGVIEAFLLFSVFTDHMDVSLLLFGLFWIVAFSVGAFALGSAVMNYGKELREKSGYLVFMTPVSSRGILGAKLLGAIAEASVLSALAVLVQMLNYDIIRRRFNMESIPMIANMALKQIGTSLSEVLGIIMTALVMVFVSSILFICIAFLAISLSVTILENHKGKVLLGGIFFVVLYALEIYIAVRIPELNLEKFHLGFGLRYLLEGIPRFLFEALCAVGAWLGSAYLLENRISL